MTRRSCHRDRSGGSAMDDVRAVTFNLGCGGPHEPACEQAAFDWASAARNDIDLVFVQEVPSEHWLDQWRATHRVITTTPRYRVVSGLLVRRSLECTPLTFATA